MQKGDEIFSDLRHCLHVYLLNLFMQDDFVFRITAIFS